MGSRRYDAQQSASGHNQVCIVNREIGCCLYADHIFLNTKQGKRKSGIGANPGLGVGFGGRVVDRACCC